MIKLFNSIYHKIFKKNDLDSLKKFCDDKQIDISSIFFGLTFKNAFFINILSPKIKPILFPHDNILNTLTSS